MKSSNVIQEKSFSFAVEILKLRPKLAANDEFIISNQLVRSSTSVGANIEEALAGQSRNDFLHKMSIALKEARETKYWLRLLDACQTVGDVNCNYYICKIDEIVKILSRIVKTLKESRSDTEIFNF